MGDHFNKEMVITYLEMQSAFACKYSNEIESAWKKSHFFRYSLDFFPTDNPSGAHIFSYLSSLYFEMNIFFKYNNRNV